jgi:hypothetical protein
LTDAGDGLGDFGVAGDFGAKLKLEKRDARDDPTGFKVGDKTDGSSSFTSFGGAPSPEVPEPVPERVPEPALPLADFRLKTRNVSETWESFSVAS